MPEKSDILIKKDLIKKYDLENHPMWDIPPETLCLFIHHDEPLEYTWQDGRHRLLTIVQYKPVHEIPVRLKAMRPVEESRLPTPLLEAWTARYHATPSWVDNWHKALRKCAPQIEQILKEEGIEHNAKGLIFPKN